MSKNRSQRALGNLRQRKNFARIPTVIGIPNLIEIQKKSFEHFLQWDITPHERQVVGLEDVFNGKFRKIYVIFFNINSFFGVFLALLVH